MGMIQMSSLPIELNLQGGVTLQDLIPMFS